jgi:hypothetical protein
MKARLAFTNIMNRTVRVRNRPLNISAIRVFFEKGLVRAQTVIDENV